MSSDQPFLLHKGAIVLARKHFASLRGQTVTFYTTQAAIAPGQAVELTDDVWESIIDCITAVSVTCKPPEVGHQITPQPSTSEGK